METQISLYNEYLGADTEISPAAVDFLKATGAAEEKKSVSVNRTGLDEYEQAMVA